MTHSEGAESFQMGPKYYKAHYNYKTNIRSCSEIVHLSIKSESKACTDSPMKLTQTYKCQIK